MVFDIADNIEQMFQKQKLEELLKVHNVSRDQVLRDTLGKNVKDFNNWKVKWSRLVNKKDKDPGNFGLLEFSTLLAKYFNARGKIDEPIISNTYFITQDTVITGIGDLQLNGQVRVWSKKEQRKLKVVEKWRGYNFIMLKLGSTRGSLRYFKPLKIIETEALYSMSIVREKKTKKLFVGYLIPLSNGNYDVVDKSSITDETISVMAQNIQVDAAAKFMAASYPNNNQWVL